MITCISIAYESLRTVGTLLLTNSDFRLFLGDLNTIGRQVFADTAFSLSEVAQETGKQLKPSDENQKALAGPGADAGPAPTTEDLGNDVGDVSKAVGNGLSKAGKDAFSSLQENLSGQQKDTLLNRLKEAVLKLRKRNDYTDSVSTIGLLVKRYALAYSRAADRAANAVQADVHTNDEVDRAFHNFWGLLSSFGDEKEWKELEKKLGKVMEHAEEDPEFEQLMTKVGTSIEKMLTDPDFFDSAEEKVRELREKSKEVGTESSLRRDVDELLVQARRTFHSVLEDSDIASLITTATNIFSILSPADATTNSDLIDDSLHVFIPLFIQAVQYLPIPRLEVSTPEIDLLLENLIIEPGVTINHSSFFPYKLRIETRNDLELRKARFGAQTSLTSNLTIKIDGLSFRASEIGYWMRTRGNLFRLFDQGIASFSLDERGIDIHMDVEICKEKMEKILTLKAVRVHVHKLTYELRKSKFSWIAWLFKPIMKPILRRTIEVQLAHAIADSLHFANRELLYARERLRATRISDPKELKTFVKAVLARLTPEEDPDVYTAVGVKPSGNVFKGVYAPGSVVKLWEQEAVQARERIEDFEVEGWRNQIFDVHAANLT